VNPTAVELVERLIMLTAWAITFIL